MQHGLDCYLVFTFGKLRYNSFVSKCKSCKYRLTCYLVFASGKHRYNSTQQRSNKTRSPFLAKVLILKKIKDEKNWKENISIFLKPQTVKRKFQIFSPKLSLLQDRTFVYYWRKYMMGDDADCWMNDKRYSQWQARVLCPQNWQLFYLPFTLW